MTTRELLEIEVASGTAKLWISRPEKRNALSKAVLERMLEVQTQLATDRTVRLIVVGSRGPVFSSGHDLTELSTADYDEASAIFSLCSLVMFGFRQLPQPVIARVQGLATAAGCQLVAACDLAVASTEAAFATPGVKIGLFCTTPMTPLVRTIAPRAAFEMLVTGDSISAQRACELGLVNRVVDPEELDAEVDRLASKILEFSPNVIAQGKQAFYSQLDKTEPEAYRDATSDMISNLRLADAREGISAFLEKRRPNWPGVS